MYKEMNRIRKLYETVIMKSLSRLKAEGKHLDKRLSLKGDPFFKNP